MIRPGHDRYEMHGFLDSDHITSLHEVGNIIAGRLDGDLCDEKQNGWDYSYKVTVIIERA